MTLMEKLEAAGYPRKEMYHHESDLYVFLTPLTKRVIDEWFKEEGLTRSLFVSTFRDQITGKSMYDVAFQSTPAFDQIILYSRRVHSNVFQNSLGLQRHR